MSYAEYASMMKSRREVIRASNALRVNAAASKKEGMHIGAEPEFYYESSGYQQRLAGRRAQIRAAHSSLLIGSSTLQERHASLEKMFSAADANRDGKLSLAEYVDSGKFSRFDAVHGGFKQAMDFDADGQVSPGEAQAAAAFEFDLLDPDLDGQVSLPELKMTLENKGWLQTKDWHVAQVLATDETLSHIISSHVETHWDADSEEGALDDEVCDPKVGEQNELVASIHQVDHALMQSKPITRAGNITLRNGTGVGLWTPAQKERLEDTMKTALEAGYGTVTSMLATDFCWKKSYDRGVGKIAGCGSGYEKIGAMCYRKCGEGYSRKWYDIEFCNSDCPDGTTDIGAFCRTNGGTSSKTCCYECWSPWGDWCCGTWCCGSCGSGFTNTGCFCEPSWRTKDRKYSPGKTMYSVGGCSDPNYPDLRMTPLGYFCYPAPRSGYACQLTTCQSRCPAWMVSCGPLACALTSGMCGANIAQMVIDVTIAVVQTAVLVVSCFGSPAATAGAATANIATSQALSAATQNSFRQAAKQSIRRFATALSEAATKEAIKAAIKNALIDYTIDTSVEAVSSAATEAIVNEIQGKSESDMDTFDFTILDPTGIATAVSTTLDSGTTDIETAAAWTTAVGILDPTGWVVAAASFMKGSCDVQAPQTPDAPVPPEEQPITEASPSFNMQEGLSALRVGTNKIEIGGSWRIGAYDSDNLAIGHADGKTCIIFRSDGTVHKGPQTDFNPWSTALGQAQGVIVGDNAIQLGSTWRIGAVNAEHLCIGHSSGNTANIMRVDGKFYHGPRTDWNPWSQDLGTAKGVYSLRNMLQIGAFLIGTRDDRHLSIGHQDGATSVIYRLDGLVFEGPRSDWNPWSFELSWGLSGLKVGWQKIQIGTSDRSWRICAIDDDHLSISHFNGQTPMIFRSDGTLHTGPRTDKNAWDYALGPEVGVTLGNNVIQLGSTWRIGAASEGEYGAKYLSFSHSSGKTANILDRDGTFYSGPRTDWNLWGRDLGSPAGVYSSINMLQINEFRIGTSDNEHLSVGQRSGQTSAIYRSDGRYFKGPRSDYNPWKFNVHFNPPPLKEGLQGIRVGKNCIQIGNSWRIGVLDPDHISFGSANGKVSIIFRSDGTVHKGPRTDRSPWGVAFGDEDGVLIGNNAIQFGSDWRIGAVNSDHLCIGHKSGKTANIMRKDGNFYEGPRTDWNPWSVDFGTAAGVYSGLNMLQIGLFRIGTIDDMHLSLGHRDGKVSVIYRDDGTIHKGPRTDWHPWNMAP